MEKIIISKNNAGERIDKFLKREVFLDEEITRGEVIRNIKAGNITVGEKKIKPSYLLKESDVIEVNVIEKIKKIIANKKIEFEIIFENDDFIAINKPAGLLVHPSSKNEKDTLVNGLVYHFPKIRNVGDEPQNRPGIVHRLDKDTSGIMIVAKNQKTFLELKEKFKNREIQKTYWALASGKFENKKGTIDAPIARAKNYKKQTIANAKTETRIREALTEYEVLKEIDGYSLVEARPKTGRTHQIRIHLSSIGHPILGDAKYGLKNTKKEKSIKKHLLHAKNIKFKFNSEKFEFEASLSEDFLRFLPKQSN
jgi:23S rRNA pseudouridine1911/1915/1917 synthase